MAEKSSPINEAVETLAHEVRAGNRRALAKAITLIEDSRVSQRSMANQLISRLLTASGGSVRVGVTGVPGVGKSTLIEALGLMLIEKGHKVAVLARGPVEQDQRRKHHGR